MRKFLLLMMLCVTTALTSCESNSTEDQTDLEIIIQGFYLNEFDEDRYSTDTDIWYILD